MFGVTVVLSLHSLALASLQFDTRVSSVSGPGITLIDNKHLVITKAGGTVHFDLYAVVTGKDADTSNDGLQSARGYIGSNGGSGPSGDLFGGQLIFPFTANGSVTGLTGYFDYDPYLDLGTTDGNAATSIAFRSNQITLGGPEFRLYHFSISIEQVGFFNSFIEFTRTGLLSSSVLWQEDGVSMNEGSVGAVILPSSPVILVGAPPIPEPASVLVLGAGGLALLPRRSKGLPENANHSRSDWDHSARFNSLKAPSAAHL